MEEWSNFGKITKLDNIPHSSATYILLTYIAPKPKANPDLDPNPNPNRGSISSGGNCPDTTANK